MLPLTATFLLCSWPVSQPRPKKFCEEVPICPRNSEAQNQKLVIRNHGDVLKNSHAATSSHQVPFSLNALRENILENSASVNCGPFVRPHSKALQLPFPRIQRRRRVPQINVWPRSQRVGEGRRISIAKHLVEIRHGACPLQCFLLALFSETQKFLFLKRLTLASAASAAGAACALRTRCDRRDCLLQAFVK